jgi:peptide chain release factor subunit 1
VSPRTAPVTVFAAPEDGEAQRRGEPLHERALQALATSQGEPAVTSLYLDVDGRHRPAWSDCDTALGLLFREARRQGEARGPDVLESVEADIRAMTAWLAPGVDRTRCRGVVLFAAGDRGLLGAFLVPVPVRDQVAVGEGPDVGQLEAILARSPTVLLVLVDRQDARLIEHRLGVLTEVQEIRDPLERAADTDVEIGNWEHRREEGVRRHLRRVAAAVTRRSDARPSHVLVVGGPAPAATALEALLPERVSNRLQGWLTVPVRAPRRQLVQVLADLDDSLEAQRQVALVDEVHSRVGTRHAVAGLAASLAALNERRASTLVVDAGYQASGARCQACGTLASSTGDCAWCGTPVTVVDDVVAEAVDLALAQRAAVEVLTTAGLGDLGHIAALERHHREQLTPEPPVRA